MEPRFDVFTTEQAAGILKITPAKMRWMLNDGQVRYARKLGGEWRIASRGIYELFGEPLKEKAPRKYPRKTADLTVVPTFVGEVRS